MSFLKRLRPRHQRQTDPFNGKEASSPPSTPGDDRERLPDVPYFLPKDEQEQNRLNFQHRCLYSAIGNHYLAPLRPDVTTMLDVGTGTGIWPTEMARLFPRAHIVGVDISATSLDYPSSATCTFCLADILKGLPFPDQQFEYVHQRLLVAAIPAACWPEVIRELVRVTRSGGCIELLEVGVAMQHVGPQTTRLMHWMSEQNQQRGFEMRLLSHLGEMLTHAGLEAVAYHDIPVPLGDWAGRVGAMLKADVLGAFDAVKGVYCAQGKMPHNQFEVLVRRAAQEWEETHASYLFHVAYGRRGPQ